MHPSSTVRPWVWILRLLASRSSFSPHAAARPTPARPAPPRHPPARRPQSRQPARIYRHWSDGRALGRHGAHRERLGSGIVYKADGIIVTNAHVVAGVQDVTVALADGQQMPATVRAADAASDVAVIQANRTGLPAATFQKPLPQVGELAVVMGSPLGFEATVTSGIISGLHRQIPGSASTGASLVDLIQTDAGISPGNSGGAVLDAQGEVVGMSVAYIPPRRVR